jgi:cytochrome P450
MSASVISRLVRALAVTLRKSWQIKKSLVCLVTKLRAYLSLDNVRVNSAGIRFLGAVMMDAGGETTASSMQSFVLALISYPECQRRAREEIDMMIGPDRLPTIEDFDNLPYLRALINEVRIIASPC